MRIKPTKGNIGVLAGVLGAVVLVSGGIITMQHQAWMSRMEEAKKLEQQVQDGRQLTRKLDEVRQALDEDRAQLAFLEHSVSDNAYVPTLLSQLEALATTTENDVLSVRPTVALEPPTKLEQRRDPDAKGKPKEDKDAKDGKKKARPEPYRQLTIKVSVIGTYASTRTFLERLTRFPKIMAVDEVQVRPHQARDSEKNLLDIEMQLTAFVMREPAAPTAANQAQAVAANRPLGETNP